MARLDSMYWASADENNKRIHQHFRGDHHIWKDLEANKAYVRKYNATFLNTLFLQTILTFIAQVIGYKFTAEKNTYKWTAIIFGVLLVINLWLAILLAIVPSVPPRSSL